MEELLQMNVLRNPNAELIEHIWSIVYFFTNLRFSMREYNLGQEDYSLVIKHELQQELMRFSQFAF